VLSQPSSARVLLERRHGEMVWSPAETCPHHLPTGQTSPDLVSCLAEIPSSYLASFPIWIFLLYFRFYFCVSLFVRSSKILLSAMSKLGL
jgi:hypothetical protein